MITDDQLDELPEDNRDAFIAFEATCRKWVQDHRSSSPNNWSVERDYATHILAFNDARAVGLTLDDEMPGDDEFSGYYDDFLGRVDRFKAKVRVELAAERKSSGTSFRIAGNFKTQIGGHLTAIRKIVQEADHLSEDKRDEIFKRIEKLQAEVSRDRTKSEIVIGLWLDITSAIGQGAEKLDPAIDRLARIMKLLGLARDDDATARLPAPAKPKRIPPPRTPATDEDEIA